MTEMAAIVLSYLGRETLVAAVRSLVEQELRPEIVVVNSGGGDVATILAAAGLEVRVIEVAKRLYAGGARNRGIAATRARYVAFLADDCIAMPGWVRARLRAHRAGAAAVASALVSHRPNSPVALAAHLSLFLRRMPRIAPNEALTYGASYDRHLFASHGMFREDLESGEDTEFHRRLPDPDKPLWCPDIWTVHVGTERLGDFLGDQYRRGRRSAEAWLDLGTITPGMVACNAIARMGFIVRQALRVVEPRHLWAGAMAIPLIVLGSVVYAVGALSVGKRRSEPLADQ